MGNFGYCFESTSLRRTCASKKCRAMMCHAHVAHTRLLELLFQTPSVSQHSAALVDAMFHFATNARLAQAFHLGVLA